MTETLKKREWTRRALLEYLSNSKTTKSERVALLRSCSQRDIRLFAEFFFDHMFHRRFGRMHREMFRLYRSNIYTGEIERRKGRRLAVAAPRGAAKSTLKTLVFPIHATLYGLERYITILSATLKQARQRLHNIKSELETNETLRRYYREELARRGAWTRGAIEVNGVRIEVFSAGAEIRGLRHYAWRPTLILLDDIEESDSVRSPELRRRMFDWYNEVIENLGDSYTVVKIVGTLLHPDALLARLLERPDFNARTYRSIEQFAEREDLWGRWREIFANLEDPHRLESARTFFNARRAEMLRGTRVLWQDKENYYDLMCQLTTKGRRAFFKEKQNEPGGGEEAFFDMERVQTFDLRGKELVFEHG
ncbi:MAG: hypothetical protein ACOC29_00975 [Candidatus Sumerlaeota bacterium]